MNDIITTKDDQLLAKNVLNRYYFNNFKNGKKELEIFLTGACKANCEYCYLKAHQKDLYPSHLMNKDLLVKNFQTILDWYVENEFTCIINIFSAEWLTTSLAPPIFDCIYNTFSKVPRSKRPLAIHAADNMQFLKDDKMTAQVEGFMDKLQELNIRFDLSVSIDGKYCEYGRTECDDEYYEKLKNFMVARDIRFHPMVSADNVKYWIDNYVWFRQTFPDQIAKEIMTLEVRNSDWTEESIQDLIRFCDFLIDYKFDEFNHNKEKFLKYILGIYDVNRGDAGIPYNVIELSNTGVCSNVDAISCSLNNSLSIRVGDLSIAPCHRLFYPELAIGKFETDENHKIVDFNVENPGLLITKCNMKRSCLPHCERCKFNDVCVGFCCGASYEEYKNMLIPQLEVCKMYQTKITFLIFKYYSMGLFDDEIFETIRDKVSPQRYKYLKDLINSFFAGGTFGDVG